MSSIMRWRSALTGRCEESEVIGGSSLELKVAGPSMLGIGCPGRHALPLTHSLPPPKMHRPRRAASRESGFVPWLDLAVSAMPPARPLHPQEATAKAAPTGTGLCGPMVRAVRLELTPPCGERLLRPSRLPIPPRPLTAPSSSIRRLDREQHLWQPAHRRQGQRG